MVITVFLFIVDGMGTKIWSAYVVGIPIYYWKDMFLGRKIGNFVVSGPYKYFNNPMYGVGQLQVYAIALYYDSLYGLNFCSNESGSCFFVLCNG
jgi:protein-S-isoprenylcysteine O-methyltransferase Ste14